MPRRLRLLACAMTLAGMCAPWAAAARTAIHLAFDDHHHDEVAAALHDVHDAATVVHGHGHEHGLPAHDHPATLIAASSLALPPTGAVSLPGVLPAVPAHAAIWAHLSGPSPPLRVALILRI